jgi:phosphotransferase system IIB component
MRILWFTFDPIVTWFAQFGWIVIVLAAMIFAVALAIFFALRKKRPVWTDESVDWLIAAFGGIDNCLFAALEGARLRVGLKDVSKADLETIRQKGGQGLFVAGNTVKLTMTPSPESFVKRIVEARGGNRP